MTERYSEIKSLINKALSLLEEEINQTKKEMEISFNRTKDSMLEIIKEKDAEIESLKKELQYHSSKPQQDTPSPKPKEEQIVEKSEDTLFTGNIFSQPQPPVQTESNPIDENESGAGILIDDADIFIDEQSSMFEIIDRDNSKSPTILGELFSTKNIVGEGIGSSPRWQTDRPGEKVGSIAEAISLNDRIYFTRELFGGDSEQFELTLERIDETDSFSEIVSEMRLTFPEWDESSDAVYRFYMTVRRKF